MNDKEQLAELEKKIAKGLKMSYIEMIEFKKRKKTPVVFWKNNKVVKIDANKIWYDMEKFKNLLNKNV